jgi:DNA polymerase
MFSAKAGHTLLICDYAQIEARILLWRVGDLEMLNQVAAGISVYEAHARSTMGWTGGKLKDEDKRLYKLAKARILGLGYGCGKDKFQTLAYTMCGLELTKKECEDTVNDFRKSNPLITNLWHTHQNGLVTSAYHNHKTHEIGLLSGRDLVFYYPRCTTAQKVNKKGEKYTSNEYWVSYVKGEAQKRTYGGRLTENEIQATARDVLRDGWVALHEAGYNVLLTVHDEYVIQVADEKVESALTEIPKILKVSSPWAKGCPIDVEIHTSKTYNK